LRQRVSTHTQKINPIGTNTQRPVIYKGGRDVKLQDIALGGVGNKFSQQILFLRY
jgi:hypothetical protein